MYKIEKKTSCQYTPDPIFSVVVSVRFRRNVLKHLISHKSSLSSVDYFVSSKKLPLLISDKDVLAKR